MAPPILRPAVPDDVAAVLAFWRIAAVQLNRTDSAADVIALIQHDPRALVLAVDGGDIVGCLITGWDGWRGSLYRMAVHPSRRREGIAGLLLSDAERRLKELGASRVGAMVLLENLDGQALWAAADFRREDDCSRWIKPL